ncbi:MAG: rhodanese-like domain-containing protein [Hyphomicrobiaceae bacterium]
MSGGGRRTGLLELLIAALYRDVSTTGPGEIAGRCEAEAEDNTVLLDVRTAGEFAVSHLPGARRVDPAASPAAVVAAAGDIAGRRVVCYCAVGVRSARFAQRCEGLLLQAGAVAVHNLSGGIFRWHNEQRPLVDAQGKTERVHPYARPWDNLVVRRHLLATTPR